MTGARGPMVTENTSSIVLTQSSIDHQNLFIVFFMPSKQLQITFIVSGLVQLNVLSHAATCQVQAFSYHRPNRTLYTFLFNNNTLNAHHSYIATGMRVIVECTTMFKISGDCQTYAQHTQHSRGRAQLL